MNTDSFRGAGASKFQDDGAKSGRDIALRCPRPRPAGGTSITGHPVAPLVRGADRAARRPYHKFRGVCTDSLRGLKASASLLVAGQQTRHFNRHRARSWLLALLVLLCWPQLSFSAEVITDVGDGLTGLYDSGTITLGMNGMYSYAGVGQVCGVGLNSTRSEFEDGVEYGGEVTKGGGMVPFGRVTVSSGGLVWLPTSRTTLAMYNRPAISTRVAP